MNKVNKKYKIAFSIAVACALILTIAIGICFAAYTPMTFANNRNKNKTSAVVNIITNDGKVADDYSVDPDSVAIASEDELKAFLQGDQLKGHLTDNVTLNWGDNTTDLEFGLDRVLDGNGFEIKLTANADDKRQPVTSAAFDNLKAGGIFVGINRGTIKNTNFRFEQIVDLQAASEQITFTFGIVTGMNFGIIENCALNVNNGSFKITKNQDSEQSNNVMSTAIIGGVAGINSGKVNFVTSSYKGVYNNGSNQPALMVNAKYRGGDGWWRPTEGSSRATVGGIIGRMQKQGNSVLDSEAFNLTVTAESSVEFKVVTDGSGKAGTLYRNVASTVGANSSYGGVMAGTSVGVIDGIVSDFNGTLNGSTSGNNSINAVIDCGGTKNVTIFNRNTDGHNADVDNCGCGGGNGDHDKTFPNRITADAGETLSVGFTADRVLTINAVAPENRLIYSAIATGKLDGIEYENQAVADYTMLDTEQPINYKEFTVTHDMSKDVKDIENLDLDIRFGDIGTMGYNATNPSYTGIELYGNFVFYDVNGGALTTDKSRFIVVDGDGNIYANTYSVGEYNMKVRSVVSEQVAYYDDETKTVIYADDTVYNDTIKLAAVNSVDSEGWRSDFTYNLTIPDGIEGAIDQLEYSVNNGATFKKVNGASYYIHNDTLPAGNNYIFRGLKDGVVVTQNSEIVNVKIDNTNPVINSINTDKSLDIWYNGDITAEISAEDSLSGIASVTVNGNLIEGIDGIYTYVFDSNIEYNIVVTDVAGNTVSRTVKPLIDKVEPLLNVRYYTLNADGERVDYESGTANSTIYLEVNITAGISGGKLYLIKNGTERIELIQENNFASYVITSNENELGDRYELVFESNTVDADGVVLVTNNIKENVIVEMPEVTITLENLVIAGNDKTYDGTDAFNGEISFAEGFTYAENIAIKAYYASAGAGDNIEIIIEFTVKDNFDIVIKNNVDGIVGNIAKKGISITANSFEKTYGDDNPLLTADVIGLVNGENLNINLSTDCVIGSVPNEGYSVVIDRNQVFDNYTVDSYVDGLIKVNKKIITNIVISDYQDFVYDGNSKIVTAYFVDVFGEEIALDGVFAKLTNGEYINVEQLVSSGDYKFEFLLSDDLALLYEIKSGINTDMFKIYQSELILDIEGDTDGIINYTFNGLNQGIIINNEGFDFVIYYGNEESETAPINVGRYNVLIIFEGNENYKYQQYTLTLNINQADLGNISFEDKTVSYNGESHSILADENSIPDNYDTSKIVYRGNEQIIPGVYTVYLDMNDNNFVNMTYSAILTINNADIVGAIFNDLTVDYTGQNVTMEISGLDDTYTVTYTNNTFVNAGEYNVKAFISKDYYNTVALEAKLIINKIAINGITMDGADYDFDNTTKSLAINGVVPEGVEVIYRNNDQLKAGKYNVTAILSGVNYIELVLTAELNINAIVVDISYSVEGELISGKKFDIYASYEDINGKVIKNKVALKGGAKDGVAGEYTVSYKITDKNYIASETTANYTFTIEKPSAVGLIIGVVVGGGVALGIIITVIIVVMSKRKKVVL